MSAQGAATFRPVKVISFELSDPSPELTSLAGYREVRALIRLHGAPVGTLTVPVHGEICSSESIRNAAVSQLAWEILRHLLIDTLSAGIPDPETSLNALPLAAHARQIPVSVSITVAVCTRDRAEDLARCLDAIQKLDPRPDEVLVVDNAPRTSAARKVVAAFPAVRYVTEPRPGLDWARNRAVLEASGDVIAFTDDDAVVDPAWVGALRRAFADRADVAAVTGLVMPYELETEAQELFERYGGFGRGCRRWWYRVDEGERAADLYAGTGRFGTGANMAFRRAVFEDIGLFDPALDVGTVTNGGGDLDMFFRVLDAGHVLLYEPDAIVWHRHRREYEKLREQLANNGVGFYSYLVRNAVHSRSGIWPFVRLGLWWLWRWNIRRLLLTFYKPGAFPRDLVLAELVGSLKGLFRYHRARRTARELAAGGTAAMVGLKADTTSATVRRKADPTHAKEEAAPAAPSVHAVDIARPVTGLRGVSGHSRVVAYAIRGDRVLGPAHIVNRHRDVSPMEVRESIADALGVKMFKSGWNADEGALWTAANDRIATWFAPRSEDTRRSLDPSVDVSIVLATSDRPKDLRRALTALTALRVKRPVEIIVVDNHPESGLTPPVVAEFPSVRMVSEPRGGLSYARNAGIAATRGSIVAMTDDDVLVSVDWLENLVAPFDDPQVMVVTGNVLPLDLSRPAQQLFEAYGGLGRGFEPFRVGLEWFWSFRRAVPTWTLGGTANAAFRSTIFDHPDIGLLDESLGAGTPAGCSEDTDLFYRVLRAGFRLVYEPQAYVWHGHRADLGALRQQIYAYAKGQVAYQLTTLVRDHDWRAVTRLLFELPLLYLWRVRTRLTGRSTYPLALVALEIAGTLAGPFAWWRSRRRVRRLGRSAPYVPLRDRKEVCDSLMPVDQLSGGMIT